MTQSTQHLRPQLKSDIESAELPEEPLPHVLQRPGVPHACVRLGELPAELVMGLDGSRTVDDAVSDAARLGAEAPELLVRLLAELGDRGFLADVPAAESTRRARLTRPGRLFGPRTWRWRRAPRVIDHIYAHGGWLLVTPAASVVFALLALAGFAAFIVVLGRGNVVPLRVNGRLGIGAACFLGGRAALVLIHELLHGLTLKRSGHSVAGAGIKLLAIFPYAYVDISPAWLEPRRRRMAVSAAGPASDVVLAGSAALAALVTTGAAREVAYQLCLAGYLAALLNLNPCLERDGYYLLCDALRRPRLRATAIADVQARLSGSRPHETSRALRWYAFAIIAWGIVGAALTVAALAGTLPEISQALPHGMSLALFATLWVLLLAPTGLLVGRPLASRSARMRHATAPAIEADRPTLPIARQHHPWHQQPAANPLAQLARRVLADGSWRERVRALGTPPGFEPLAARELRSTIAGVVLAAGAESLALAHGVDVAAPAVEHFTQRTIDGTSFAQLRTMLGLDHPSAPVTPHLEPNLEAVRAPRQEPILYESPAHAAAPASTSGTPLGAFTDWQKLADPALASWPGNGAGPVAIAHWMANGAEAAGLPGPLPVMAALTESGLNDHACCDLDSLGYFQMRESIWNFGPYAGFSANPELQLQWFIDHALGVRDEMIASGAAGFGQDPSTWGMWIAAVERPAAQYDYRYQLQLGNAEDLLGQPVPPTASTALEPMPAAGSTVPGPAAAAPAGASHGTPTGGDGGERLTTPTVATPTQTAPATITTSQEPGFTSAGAPLHPAPNGEPGFTAR